MRPTNMSVSVAFKPDGLSIFSSYSVIFSPEIGLSKVVQLSKLLEPFTVASVSTNLTISTGFFHYNAITQNMNGVCH